VGADTPAWLAGSPEVEGISGAFFAGRRQVQTAPHTTDRERCERLWDESARLVGLAPRAHRSFQDPDGHHWEALHMDVAAAPERPGA
jgi:hypothetical protein